MRDDMDDPHTPALPEESAPPAVIQPEDAAPPQPSTTSKSPDFLDEFLVHATANASSISPNSPGDDTPSHVDMADNDPFLAELFSQAQTKPAPGPPPPPPPVEGVEKEQADTPAEAVFKRPFSPRASPDRGAPEGGAEGRDRGGHLSRMRREMRLQHHPLQRCFLTGIKQKRSETDDGHMAAVLNALKDGGKLLLPDIVLRSYLEEAGLAVGDSKVARLVGAMAEEHTASIIQDSMQIYVDNQHERRRPPHTPAAGAKDKETASGASAASSTQASASTVASAPATGKGSKSKGTKSSNGKKASKGKRRKADPDTEAAADDAPSSMDMEAEPLERDAPDIPPVGAAPEGDAPEAPKDPEKAASLASKEDSKRPSKRERDKDVERRNVLAMEVLGPVLREHGYHVGRPPYFVN